MPSKPWADQPWPLIPTPPKQPHAAAHSSFRIATTMTQTHNCIIRGINTIYLQAPHVHQEKDIRDLLFFCRVWCGWVGHHHQLEEEHMFPGFERVAGKPGFMEKDVEQHHAFEPGLEKLREYAVAGKADGYDSKELQGIIDEFAGILQQHLKDEISTLLELRDCNSDDLMAVYKAAEKKAGRQAKEEIFPMVLGLCDKSFPGAEDFPPAPWIAPYIIHCWFARRHAGAWRLLPSDMWGRRRDLPFVSST